MNYETARQTRDSRQRNRHTVYKQTGRWPSLKWSPVIVQGDSKDEFRVVDLSFAEKNRMTIVG